jgi:hypothetical protein
VRRTAREIQSQFTKIQVMLLLERSFADLMLLAVMITAEADGPAV